MSGLLFSNLWWGFFDNLTHAWVVADFLRQDSFVMHDLLVRNETLEMKHQKWNIRTSEMKHQKWNITNELSEMKYFLRHDLQGGEDPEDTLCSGHFPQKSN